MNLLQIHEPGQTPEPHAGGTAVGIDLGTTHSVVAVALDGLVRVLRNAQDEALIPSVVQYAAKTVVGSAARAATRQGAADTVSSIKRLMGRSARDATGPLAALLLPDDGGMARLKVGARTLTPVEISADILRYLKNMAEVALERQVTQAVITVPAYFDDAARQATKDAARLAGLEVLRLINEPTAAALAYGLENGSEGLYAIYDLGGGTFDISILKLEKGVFQVLATGGDIALGGDDLDQAIAEWFLSSPSPFAGEGREGGESGAVGLPPCLSLPRKGGGKLNDLPRKEGGDRQGILLAIARAAKERLSDVQETTLEYSDRKTRLTRITLEALVAPFIDKTLSLCTAALEDAGLAASAIKGTVLVGGSTRIPLVRAKVETFFGKPPLTDINPDEVVAVGAAIQAEGLTRGSDNLLLDVVPLSLGLETMGGLVEKIIYRNTPIPIAAEQSFTTYKDGQTGMIIHVLQGERELVEQNRSLARFELAGIPPLPAGIARIKVTFSVDADGLLSVAAREETTGTEQHIVVKPSYGLEEGEIERMLLESMENARADITARLLYEARAEAHRTIEEINSALARDSDLLKPQEKQDIALQIQALLGTAEDEDRDAIDAEAARLHTLTQSFAERRMDRAIQSALKGAHIDDAANG